MIFRAPTIFRALVMAGFSLPFAACPLVWPGAGMSAQAQQSPPAARVPLQAAPQSAASPAGTSSAGTSPAAASPGSASPGVTSPAAPKKKPPAPDPRAAEKRTGGPKSIGKFDDWTAATHQEAGQMVCYAFTRAQSSAPAVAGRGQVILTVTQRASGRDAVALEAGFTFAPNAAVIVQADQTGLEFYTAQRNAFARNGRAAVSAFESAGRAIARSPGPREAKITDTFSLKGFKAAYTAVSKACPSR